MFAFIFFSLNTKEFLNEFIFDMRTFIFMGFAKKLWSFFQGN